MIEYAMENRVDKPKITKNHDYGDYVDVIKDIDPTIQWLVQVDEGSYQGDTFLIGRKDTNYVYLTFGWGSCSGCDAYQACSSQEDFLALQKDLLRDMMFFKDIDSLILYLVGEYGNSISRESQVALLEFINLLKTNTWMHMYPQDKPVLFSVENFDFNTYIKTKDDKEFKTLLKNRYVADAI